jgi:L-alanine-DL-glutamate epimerase-like enolase superfamily enzyme
VPPTPEAGALATALAALPLRVDAVRAVAATAAVRDYPGGRRPTSTVTVAGGGLAGEGEHVGWTAAEQAAFADAAPGLAPRGDWRLGAWSAEVARRTPGPYARAALEAAALELALAQSRTSLLALAGVAAPRPVSYVVSFARRSDAPAVARALRASAPDVGLKVDVDPDWPETTWTELAEAGGVCVLDFKLTGTVAAHERAHRLLPGALLEDPRPGDAPWSASLRRRLSVDAALDRAAAVATLPGPPAAANVKPARMGGVLELLRAAAACRTAGIDVYVGGMFEVGIGRRQLWTLAALLAPDGPNDVAPIAVGAAPAPRPPRLRLAAGLGFAATLV